LGDKNKWEAVKGDDSIVQRIWRFAWCI